MPFDYWKYHRRSIRLKGYDYRTAGAYFVTICIQERQYLLGEIVEGELSLGPAGQMVAETWSAVPDQFPTVALDAFVIMPNHIHLILFLLNPDPPALRGTNPRIRPGSVDAETGSGQAQGPTSTDARPSLAEIIGWFKSITTAKYRHGVYDDGWRPFPGRLWQRNYYEHIIRNERSLDALRQYIYRNPMNWSVDKLFVG